MATTDEKWMQIEARLSGWAAALLDGLTQAERRQAWLASRALVRRPASRSLTAAPLSVESAFEAAVQRLLAARAGDAASGQAFERLVRDGYLADREESLPDFGAGLDPSTRLEVASLACFAHRQRGEETREAVMKALRLAYDRTHHPDEAQREQSAQTLTAVLGQVEASPLLRHAVGGFVADHLRSFEPPLD
jgi:hypothetical protein